MAHPELQWISDISAFWWFRRVISLSACLRILLIMRVVSLFALLYLSFPFHRSISISLHIWFHVYISFTTFVLCVADPSWSLTSGFLLVISCHAIIPDLSITCFLLTHVYHLTSSVLSSDHLTCYYLARPSCYIMTYPDLLSISCRVWLLADIIILSCYLLTPSMILRILMIITITGM